MCSKQMPVDTHRWFMETSAMEPRVGFLYTRLLFTLWNQGTPYTVADDDELLQRLLGFPENWPSVKKQLFTYWTLENGVWLHPELLAEHQKQERTSQSRRKNVESRWAKQESRKQPAAPVSDKKEHQPSAAPGEAAIASPGGDKWGTADDLALAREIHQAAVKLDPHTKEPFWADWANTIRLMRETDNYTTADICSLFRWGHRDRFWFKILLSPAALRKNAVKVRLSMQAANGHSAEKAVTVHVPRVNNEIDYLSGIDNGDSWLPVNCEVT